jgi:hypothetical protein
VLNQRSCPPTRTLLLQSEIPPPLTRTGPRLSSFRFVAAKTVRRLAQPNRNPIDPTASAANASGSVQTTLSKLPRPHGPAILVLLHRGSPDRDLSFISIDPGKLPRSRLLESQPTNACALANKAAQYHAKAQLMGMFPNHSFSVYQSTRSCRSRTSSGQAARPTRPRLCQRPTVLK